MAKNRKRTGEAAAAAVTAKRARQADAEVRPARVFDLTCKLIVC